MVKYLLVSHNNCRNCSLDALTLWYWDELHWTMKYIWILSFEAHKEIILAVEPEWRTSDASGHSNSSDASLKLTRHAHSQPGLKQRLSDACKCSRMFHSHVLVTSHSIPLLETKSKCRVQCSGDFHHHKTMTSPPSPLKRQAGGKLLREVTQRLTNTKIKIICTN